MKKNKKNEKSLAAFLNFIAWGLGYAYNGKKITLGLILLTGFVLIHYYWAILLGFREWLTYPTILVFVGHLLVSTGLAYDVYKS